MMVDVNINGIDIEITNDFNISYSIKDSLGYATFELLLDNKMKFDYFDKVIINNENYYLIDYKEINKGFKYHYTIDIVTPEISLQTIILPNRASVAKGDKKTYIDHLVELYAFWMDIDSEVLDFFEDIPMLEYTWTKPTLFEVLNEIMQEHGKIVKMSEYNVISMRDINYRGDEFNGEITNAHYNSDFENYATGFSTTINNAISDNLIKEYVKFKTPDSPIIEDNNFQAYLSQPVERINKVVLVTKGWGDINTPAGLVDHIEQVRVNITDMFVEKTIYDTKLNGAGGKVDFLYYEYGTNVLGGFDYNESKWWGGSFNTWENLVALLETEGSYNDMVDTDLTEVKLYVEYVAKIEEIDVVVKNSSDISEDKIIIYNQNEPIINMDNFAKKQSMLIKRAKGDKIELHGIGTPPKLLDTYKGYTFFNIIVSSYKWSAFGSENYIDINIRTKINSSKMFTSIISSDKALIMNHVTNYQFMLTDVESDYNDLVDNFNLVNNDARETYLILKPDSVPYHLIKTPFLEKYNNSLIMHFKMDDNYSAGNKLLKRNNKGAQDIVPYTNIDGELDNINIQLYRGDVDDILLNNVINFVDNTEFPNDYPPVKYINAYNSIVKEQPEINENKRPYGDAINYSLIDLYKSNKLLYSDTLSRYKTTREILAETVQLTLLTSSKVHVSNNYIDVLNWGEYSIKHIGVRYETDGTPYSEQNYMHGTQRGTEVLIYNNGSYELDVMDSVTGWAVLSNNKLLFYYNGTSKKLYFSAASYERFKLTFSYLGKIIINGTTDLELHKGTGIIVEYGGVIDVNASSDIELHKGTGIIVAYDGAVDVSGNLDFVMFKNPHFSYKGIVNVSGEVNVTPPPKLRWHYNKVASGEFCFIYGINPIGESCSVENATMIVAGEDIGVGSGCHELICKF